MRRPAKGVLQGPLYDSGRLTDPGQPRGMGSEKAFQETGIDHCRGSGFVAGFVEIPSQFLRPESLQRDGESVLRVGGRIRVPVTESLRQIGCHPSEASPYAAARQKGFPELLDNVDAVQTKDRTTLTCAILLRRWSGLAIIDASCLLKARLLPGSNQLQTYRQKTEAYVSVTLPNFVADLLRMQSSEHPDYFFWDKNRRNRRSQV